MQALASQAAAAVYENQPTELPQDVVRGGYSPSSWAADAAAVNQQEPQYTKRLKEKFLLESQQQKTVERPPIRLDEGEGGVYENEPVQLPDVVRSDRGSATAEDYRLYAEGKCATLAKQRWMSEAAQKAAAASGERRVTLELANDSGVYENCPEVRQGVARWGGQDDEASAAAAFDPTGAYSRAVSAWQQNSQGSAVVSQPRTLDIDPQSGGIFENNPAPQADGIVRYGADDNGTAPAAVAGSARNARDQYERSLLLNSNGSSGGGGGSNAVADSGLDGDDSTAQLLPDLVQAKKSSCPPADAELLGAMRGGAGAAKRQLLLRQREAEAAASAGRPGMIDIWAELSEHSGIFENEPQQRPADLVRSGRHNDD